MEYDREELLSSDAMIEHYMRLAPIIHEIADTQTIRLFNERLLQFLDREFHRLVNLRVSIGDEDGVEEQYKHLHLFIKAVLPFFPEIYERLQCYHVTFLIGMANIAGAKRNNLGQLSAAHEALEITNSLREWIEHAYIDGRNFHRGSVQRVCDIIIERAEYHLVTYYSNQ